MSHDSHDSHKKTVILQFGRRLDELRSYDIYSFEGESGIKLNE